MSLSIIAGAIATLYADLDEAIAQGDTILADVRFGVLSNLYGRFEVALAVNNA